MKTLLNLLVLLVVVVTKAQSQSYVNDDPYLTPTFWVIMGSGGVGSTGISGTTRMLIPPDYDPSTYTTKENSKLGGIASFAFSTRINNTSVYFQPEITYQKSSASLHYADINKTEYDLNLNYHYLNLGVGFRINPLLNINAGLGGIHLGIGANYGINVKDHLSYSSMPDPQDDEFIEAALRNTFKAKNNFSGFFGLGYDYHFDNGIGLNLDIRQNFGVSDIIETKPNGWFFSDTKNQTKSYTIMLGVTYPLNP